MAKQQLLTEHEVVLRVATNNDVDRKLKIACRSRFFWLYSLSLWDPDAFWRCVIGAIGFAFAGLLMRVILVGFTATFLTATVMFEYFLLGLILMWPLYLGAWLHPTNFKVILTFIFTLYRKNKTAYSLSAKEIDRLFPSRRADQAFNLKQLIHPSRIYARIERSPVLGPLLMGFLFAFFLVSLLRITS